TNPNDPFIVKPQICRMLQLRVVQPGDPLKDKSLNIKVSHFGDWYSFKRIRRMKLSFSNVDSVMVSRISLQDDRNLMPDFRVTDRGNKPNGEYVCTNVPVEFEAKNPGIEGVHACQVDISKVNQSWDTFVATNAHGEDEVINRSFRVPLVDGKASFHLNPAF